MSILLHDKYILPTPVGAYYCIVSKEIEPAKRFLQHLMTGNEAAKFDTETLNELLGGETNDQEQILFHIQKLKWLQGFDQARKVVDGTIEDTLPDILELLSSDGKAMLADDKGFYLSSAGFTHKASEELSALSGDLSSLYVRHQGILKGNLNIKSSAFALVDAAGYSQLGFWPIYIGELLFMLVISGVPRFDQDAFVNLIWLLHKRYYIDNAPSVSDAA